MSNSGRVAELAGVQVLVVDDDPDSLDMMQAALLYGGARVTGAPSAMKAIEALGRVTPNVIVCDLKMPQGDGLTLARHVHSIASLRSIPILAVTGYDELDVPQELHAAGFIGVLRKPVTFRDLIRVVAALAEAGKTADSRHRVA
jgi:CheY-like chemotaxis protein